VRGPLCLLVVALLAGCGEAEEPVSPADPNRPVQAPADQPSAIPPPAAPADCRRLSRRLVGRTHTAARALADEARCPLRVVVEDGRSLPVTDDLQRSRINVRTERGVVVEIAGLF
jgi:hypothetical protein